jgi:cell division protease FtsH
LTPKRDPLHKSTDHPRAAWRWDRRWQLPLDDKHCYNKGICRATAILMGGRIAEEIFMHHINHCAGQRHRTCHRHGSQDGRASGHERTGSDELRQARRADLPGAEIAQHRDLQRSYRDPHR